MKGTGVVIALFMLALTGLLVWACFFSGPACPPGQVQVQTGVLPQYVNGEPIYVPQFACENP